MLKLVHSGCWYTTLVYVRVPLIVKVPKMENIVNIPVCYPLCIKTVRAPTAYVHFASYYVAVVFSDILTPVLLNWSSLFSNKFTCNSFEYRKTSDGPEVGLAEKNATHL
jgi:hypothetical protein